MQAGANENTPFYGKTNHEGSYLNPSLYSKPAIFVRWQDADKLSFRCAFAHTEAYHPLEWMRTFLHKWERDIFTFDARFKETTRKERLECLPLI